MKDVALLVIHLISLLIRLLQPGGIKAVVAENLLLKQQLLVIRRSRGKAPNLNTLDGTDKLMAVERQSLDENNQIAVQAPPISAGDHSTRGLALLSLQLERP